MSTNDQDVLINGITDKMVGNSAAIQKVKKQIVMAAKGNFIVLLCGETGVGKGLAARAIHEVRAGLTKRRNSPFVTVNCVTLPNDLIEAELFGFEKGSFTGAMNPKKGLFEVANDGTAFLDEIGELTLVNQAKFLQVLEEFTIRRIGGVDQIKVNPRIIAATNKNLYIAVFQKSFREDLWHRLNVFTILIPPLRERPEDVPLLIDYFTSRHNRKGDSLTALLERPLNPKLVEFLTAKSWPGNVRHLKNSLDKAIAGCEQSNSQGRKVLDISDFDFLSREAVIEARYQEVNVDNLISCVGDRESIIGSDITLRTVHDMHVTMVTERSRSFEEGQKRLGLSVQGYINKLRRLGLERPGLPETKTTEIEPQLQVRMELEPTLAKSKANGQHS